MTCFEYFATAQTDFMILLQVLILFRLLFLMAEHYIFCVERSSDILRNKREKTNRKMKNKQYSHDEDKLINIRSIVFLHH